VIDKPEIKVDLNIPGFDIPPTKVEIQKLMLKLQSDDNENINLIHQCKN
jgi:coenzyme F420-reducing hydrogenase gamma subunit